jgi:aspartate racemase
MACNTSYSPEIYGEIVKALNRQDSRMKLVNMPLETCCHIKQQYPAIRRIGLMTTSGSYKSGVYRKPLLDLGFDVVLPDLEFQDNIIHKMIYDPEFGIKSNAGNITSEAKMLWQKALRFFASKKTQGIILGCTELSLMPKEENVYDIVIVDSTQVLAQSLIREATAGVETAVI